MSYSEQQHYSLQKVKELRDELNRIPLISDWNKKYPNLKVLELFGFITWDKFLTIAGLKEKDPEPKFKFRDPKILVLDIETKPLKAYCWGLFDQNISLDMIIEDWSVMSWAAKWIDNSKIFYQDLSQNTDYTKDELIVRGIWELLNECDVVLTQNGKRFDIPKLNAKFVEYKIGPPSPFKHIDTYTIKKKLGLTSKKLEYTTNKFNEQYKKLKHAKFSGMSLWIECLKGNQEAWSEMKEYNIHDVLALEELYVNHLRKFDNTINYGVYTGNGGCPNCGSDELTEKEHGFTKTGAFQVFLCRRCGTFSSSKNNELSKAIKSKLLK